MPEAIVVSLIRITVTEGDGVEGDPKRLVDYYYTLDGVQVIRVDTWEEERRKANGNTSS